MDPMILPPVILTPLRRIQHPKGDIFHGMRISDPGFSGFGEAYFTSVAEGETKGWKKHTVMHLNLVVPVGEVEFHLRADDETPTRHFRLGGPNYARLTVPPGYWLAFSGRANGLNLVLNIASHQHAPEEAINLPLEAFPVIESTS